jgi:LPS export ABC transporter protein LptC
MIKNPRNLLWIIPLGLLISSPLWKSPVEQFLKPRGGYDAKVAEAYKRKDQHFVMDDISITLSSNGHVEWQVTAERAFTGKTDREIGMIEVDAVYTGKDRDPVTISSNRGTYLMDERHLILIDNVVLRNPARKEVLHTELLHYYDAAKMLVSPVDVDIQGEKFSLQAGRMDYDLASDAYDFNDRVTVDL